MKNEDSMQLINSDGVFNISGLNEFVEAVKLDAHGNSYRVVSIMGPQGSGKSTLLNHLFGTSFTEMDSQKKRKQTTQGVWMENCVSIDHCTLVMDLEGTDGKERGEDGTTFEKQSALFALAISNIVIINMWGHDIGREHAASRPLLRTVFKVMMRLCKLSKTTLLLVIRDKTKTPLEILQESLKEDIEQIWDAVCKPEDYKGPPLNKIFYVEVVALPNYEDKIDEFKVQVSNLRQRINHLIAPGGMAGDRQDTVHASLFASNAEKIWNDIKEEKELNLPKQQVMLANFRCEEIANDKFSHLLNDEKWHKLKDATKRGPVNEFLKELKEIMEDCLSKYDTEAIHYDQSIRSAKRRWLKDKALDDVYPAYQSMLWHLWSRKRNDFRNDLDKALQRHQDFTVAAGKCLSQCLLEFDQECSGAHVEHANWDPSKIREKLRCDIDDHIASVRNEKLKELTAKYEKQLRVALEEPVGSLLRNACNDAWPKIRTVLERETAARKAGLSRDLSSLVMDQMATGKMLASLANFGRRVVEKRAREEARNVSILMKDRFLNIFKKARAGTQQDNIPNIVEYARSQSLKLLSLMAVIRLDDRHDNIEKILSDAALISSADLLDLSTWKGVPTTDVLITPTECNTLWRELIEDTQYVVDQAWHQSELLATAWAEKKKAQKIKMAATLSAVGLAALAAATAVATGVPIPAFVLAFF